MLSPPLPLTLPSLPTPEEVRDRLSRTCPGSSPLNSLFQKALAERLPGPLPLPEFSPPRFPPCFWPLDKEWGADLILASRPAARGPRHGGSCPLVRGKWTVSQDVFWQALKDPRLRLPLRGHFWSGFVHGLVPLAVSRRLDCISPTECPDRVTAGGLALVPPSLGSFRPPALFSVSAGLPIRSSSPPLRRLPFLPYLGWSCSTPVPRRAAVHAVLVSSAHWTVDAFVTARSS